MPLYNFRERFAQYVKEGTKECTIRAIRKRPAKPGDTLHLYTGLRTKHTALLRRELCTKVHTIFIGAITGSSEIILLQNQVLTEAEALALLENPDELIKQNDVRFISDDYSKDQFAWNDGFRFADNLTRREGCFDMMLKYWKETHALPFAGHHINWIALPF